MLTERINVRFTKKEVKEIKRLAKKEGSSVSGFIRGTVKGSWGI